MENRTLGWCGKQKKGIKLVLPNDNICRAYLKKAKSSLQSMNLNYGAGIIDWAVDAAYYARYQSIYALFQKVGIKCEIHDCTIKAFRILFADIFNNSFFDDIENAKEQRINMTYYTDRLVPKEEIKENIDNAAAFVIEIEKYIETINPMDIQKFRAKLKKII